jgi:hypothetical protein
VRVTGGGGNGLHAGARVRATGGGAAVATGCAGASCSRPGTGGREKKIVCDVRQTVLIRLDVLPAWCPCIAMPKIIAINIFDALLSNNYITTFHYEHSK